MAKNRKTPDMNLPVWFDGQNINEALFCEEFLQERRIIFANGAFFTPDGRVTDDLPLRGEIYDKLKFCAVNNIPRKITNILEVLKLEAQVPDFPPEQDRIHLSNGTLLLNGTFTEGRPAIVRNRLPVVYNPHAPTPVTWLNFLDGLLYAEDIPTLQEFIGYHGLQDIPKEHKVFSFPKLSIREQMAAYQEIIDGSSLEGYRQMQKKDRGDR